MISKHLIRKLSKIILTENMAIAVEISSCLIALGCEIFLDNKKLEAMEKEK